MKDDGRRLPERIEDMTDEDMEVARIRLAAMLESVPQITEEYYNQVVRTIMSAP